MRLFQSTHPLRYRALPPQREQSRDGYHLLVWGDVPHWMVIDEEFRLFLRALDGSKTWGELLAQNPAWKAQQKALQRHIQRLEELGVIHETSNPKSPKVLVQSRKPIENLSVFMTRRCNLRCAFCYARPHLNNRAEGELGAAEIITFLRSIRPHLAKSFSLSLLGGEPALVPEKTLDLARFAQQQGWPCLVSTNAQQLSRDFARAACQARLQVQVSLDGHDAPHHEAIRGPGSYAKALVGAKLLVEAGAHTILSLVCHQGNLAHLKDFYDLAVRLGVNEARFIPLKRIGGAQSGALQPVRLADLLAEAHALFAANPHFLKLGGRDALSIVAGTCRLSARRSSCGAGEQAFLLDADGSLYPCLNLHVPALRLGNIRAPGFDFARLWQESLVLQKVRAAISVENPTNPCAHCVVRHWCLGGCHGETLAVTGQLQQRAWNCADQKQSILEMFWRLAQDSRIGSAANRSC